MIIISILVVGGAMIQRGLAPKLEIPEPLEASVLIQHGNVDEYRVLSLADTVALRTLLHGQQLREQAPSCEFSETVAVRLNQGARMLYIGLGKCRGFRDGETGKYVTLNRAQWNVFTEILASYGLTVPGGE